MGVQGLWELLAPVGRRVSVEVLNGRKLAIDASIWLIQFMKAMRDDKGDMIRNAHLLGFFRRICKLLYLRVKPVFVFDGGTPALKRRTVIARRRQRERAQSKLRKTAEKLLLNHLRTRRLDEIAKNIGLIHPERNKETVTDAERREKEISGDGSDQNPLCENFQETAMSHDDDELKASTSGFGKDDEVLDLNTSEKNISTDSSDEDGECVFIPPAQGRVDPAVLASLPPSMQLDLLVQMREQLVADNRKKFQKVAENPASFSQLQIQAYLKTVAFRRDINEVQKAAAGKGIGGIPTSRIASEANREFIFSSCFKSEVQHDKVDGEEPIDVTNVHQEDAIASENVRSTVHFSPNQNEIASGASEDNDIEWETEDDFTTVHSQPIKEVIVEINENDLESEGVDFRSLFSEIEPTEQHIEWEDSNVETRNNKVMDEIKVPEGRSGGDDRDVEWEDARWLDELKGTNKNDIVHENITEIEAAELEEAIRRSLEDYGTCRTSKLVIKNAESIETKIPQETLCSSSFSSALDSEASFLVQERERKGKDILTAEHRVSRNMQSKTSALKIDGSAVTLNEDNYDQFTLEKNVQLHSKFESYNAHQTEDSLIINDSNARQATGLSKIENEGTLKAQDLVHCLTDISVQRSSVRQDTKNIEISENHVLLNPVVEQIGGLQYNTVSKEILRTDTKLDRLAGNLVDRGVDSEFVSQGEETNDPRVGCCNLQGFTQVSETLLGDGLLDAEKLNLLKDQEQFSQEGGELLAERELLCRQHAELQAQLEEEHAAIESSLQDERDRLLEEEMELRASQQKNQRNAESVSGEMFSECQELLQMFGLPYIIAPMEAEAQCAFMDSVGLVDGIVTDDCDVFLFGGRNVYKNIFDDRKYVETYYMKDIETELGLDQKKLIHMALLLGSDYTEGISGIGIVNAIEVVNAFGGESGLQKFREWLDAPDLTLLDKIPGGSKKQMKKKMVKENKVDDDGNDIPSEVSETSNYDDRQQNFMEKHRAVSKNWSVPESFPNPMVVNAYLSPQVDQSTESFAWGRPDLESLRKLCVERFGWNKVKSDELLLPVLKEYDRHETQLRLEAFYSFNQRFAKIRSKRIQKAVSQVTGFMSTELMDIPDADSLPSSRIRLEGKRVKSRNDSMKKSSEKEDLEGTAGPNITKSQAFCNTEEPVSDSLDQERQKGRGRNRAKGGCKGTMLRGTRKRQSLQRGDRSCTDESSSEDLQEGQLQDGGFLSRELRRSARVSKRPTYVVSGSEDEDSGGNTENEKLEFGNTCTSIMIEDGVENENEKSGTPSRNIVAEDVHVQVKHSYDHPAHKEYTEMADLVTKDFTVSQEPDYLVMGGGFCASGDEHDQDISHVEETIRENIEAHVDAFREESCADSFQTIDGSGGDNSVKELFRTNAGQSSTGNGLTFRAIPSLRRKKQRTK